MEASSQFNLNWSAKNANNQQLVEHVQHCSSFVCYVFCPRPCSRFSHSQTQMQSAFQQLPLSEDLHLHAFRLIVIWHWKGGLHTRFAFQAMCVRGSLSASSPVEPPTHSSLQDSLSLTPTWLCQRNGPEPTSCPFRCRPRPGAHTGCGNEPPVQFRPDHTGLDGRKLPNRSSSGYLAGERRC